jgi:hypothetical protein
MIELNKNLILKDETEKNIKIDKKIEWIKKNHIKEWN